MGGLGSGGPRPNSGPKPRSLRDRAVTNPRIRLDDVNVAPFPSPPPASPLRDWKPTRAQRNRLRKRGRAFLDARLAAYGHTPAEGDTLLRACSALDEADVWRRRSHSWKDPDSAIKAGRLALLYEREAATALALLKETR